MYKSADEEQWNAVWHSFDLQINLGELLIPLDQSKVFLSARLSLHFLQRMQVLLVGTL